MRGNMKTTSSFERALLMIFMAGISGVVANGQTQKASPVKHASSYVAARDASPVKQDTIPVSTKSAEARRKYEMGMLHYEDLLMIDEGLDFLRDAVKADPHFALGHAMLGFATFDPMEAHRHRALSKHLIANASPDERLQIRWLNGTKDGQIVPAIAAMNDLLSKYPNDKQFANTVAAWLCSNEQAYDRGAEILERLLAKDDTYGPAMNNLAYCYALGGRANLAPAWMEKYIAAMPDQPNPQDSYGEISRMMGNFPAALEHYQAALKISPSFTSSQVGIATTYALMGDEERARAEYLKANEMTKDAPTIMNYRLLWAMTYFRENQIERGRKAHMEVAEAAHKAGFAVQEAEAHRAMGLFNPDAKGALRDLDAARAVLTEKHVLSSGDHDTELATILQTRAYVAAIAGQNDVAKAALAPLTAMARTSRDNLIQQSYHSANGATLLLEGMYADAVSELQYDPRNPLSLQLLAEAETKAGEPAAGRDALSRLAGINDERVETAYAAPRARAKLSAAPSGSDQPAAEAKPAPVASARSTGFRGGPLQ
jgi:tetratricopeptide (TPR) repeat protein